MTLRLHRRFHRSTRVLASWRRSRYQHTANHANSRYNGRLLTPWDVWLKILQNGRLYGDRKNRHSRSASVSVLPRRLLLIGVTSWAEAVQQWAAEPMAAKTTKITANSLSKHPIRSDYSQPFGVHSNSRQ